MIKVVYSLEQMQDLSRMLNMLTVTGLDNNRLISAAASIIDSPVEQIEEDRMANDTKKDGEKK